MRAGNVDTCTNSPQVIVSSICVLAGFQYNLPEDADDEQLELDHAKSGTKRTAEVMEDANEPKMPPISRKKFVTPKKHG